MPTFASIFAHYFYEALISIASGSVIESACDVLICVFKNLIKLYPFLTDSRFTGLRSGSVHSVVLKAIVLGAAGVGSSYISERLQSNSGEIEDEEALRKRFSYYGVGSTFPRAGTGRTTDRNATVGSGTDSAM